MNDNFLFQLHNQLHYGIGYSRKLGELITENGWNNIALLVDEGVARKSIYYREILYNVFHKFNVVCIFELRGNEEPDYQYLDEIAAKVRSIKKIDALVGIGGGSCLDITKAIAVLITNPGKGIEYRGFHKVKVPGIPTIAIPTTAGTGSEVTINAVFTDKSELRKLGINGNYMNATHAVLDAEWSLSCPLKAAVSAGLDALVHAIESYQCKPTNILVRLLSKQAFHLLYNALPSLIDDSNNKEMRQQLLLGSYLAGAALFNSGSGLSALSYPIGVHFKVPHGFAGGIFLSSMIAYNVNHEYLGYSELYDIIEPCSILSEKQKNLKFIEAIQSLLAKLNVPKYLDQWGITKENIDKVAGLMSQLEEAFDNNPVHFSAKTDAIEMLKKHVKP